MAYNKALSFEDQRRQDLLDGKLPKTSNKNARPRTGDEPAPAMPYHPMLGPLSESERELASHGKVPPPYRNVYGNNDMPDYPTGPAVMLPPQQRSAFANTVNSIVDGPVDRTLQSIARPIHAAAYGKPAPVAAPAATTPAQAAPAIPTPNTPSPAPAGGPLQARPDPYGLWARPNDPLGLQPRPTAQAGVMGNAGPSGAAPQLVGGGFDLSPDRLGGERKALMMKHEDVMRQLRMLGPSYGRPENEGLRLSLIQQRRDLEDRIGTLGRAMGPGPVVSPADAEAGRARLARTTGVDVRPDREKALAYAIALSNADPRGAGLESPSGLEAADINRPFEEADFAKRQAARDARTAQARRELTTPLPGGEAPLSEYERMRRQETLDMGRTRDLETARFDAGIRTLGNVGKMEDAQIRMTEAQTEEIAARAGVSKAQARQIIDELQNADSTQNRLRQAERDATRRKAAAISAGADEGTLRQDIDAFDNGGDWTPEHLNMFDTNVVSAAERLARSGDPQAAARAASIALSKLPDSSSARFKDAVAIGLGGQALYNARQAALAAQGKLSVRSQAEALRRRLQAIVDSAK